MRDTPTGRAVAAMREHRTRMHQLGDQIDGDSLDEATVIAWADSATVLAESLRALCTRPSLTAVPDDPS